MNHFEYHDGQLHCEGMSLAKIAEEQGTPAYVYSRATLERHFRVFDESLAGARHLICFAVKANSNIAVLHLLGALGAGADIVSGGELARALKAGIPASRIVFSGVGKTRKEMEQALDAEIFCFNVESEAELKLLSEVAAAKGVEAPISLRINPDVDAKTHPYISTGLAKNKFGIPWSRAIESYELATALPGLQVVGVDCHIGSQLTETQPFIDAARKLDELVDALAAKGILLKHIDIGGGLGIPYSEPGEGVPPSPAIYGTAVVDALKSLKKYDVTLVCEPGRVISGNAGILLTEVLYTKSSETKTFVVTDAASNDLMRPTLYDAYHPMFPVKIRQERPKTVVDVVGPICETGDFFARDRELPDMQSGELLAIGSAGAYGFSMSSNYNSRTRACEILVSGEDYAVVRKRESQESLWALESIPEFPVV